MSLITILTLRNTIYGCFVINKELLTFLKFTILFQNVNYLTIDGSFLKQIT
jgi:hypothetical protein